MSTPFDTTAPAVDAASDAQLRCVATLLAKRDWQSMPNAKYVARVCALNIALGWAQRPMAKTTPPLISRLINNTLPRKAGDGERLNVIMADLHADAVGSDDAELYGPLTRKGASTLIEGLMTLPKRGIWVTDEGQTIKVQEARNGSGRLYAKLMDEDGRFDYVGGLIGKLASQVRAGRAHRMTADEAKAYGALYDRCIECGRTLTDEDSIERGVRPVCMLKFS